MIRAPVAAVRAIKGREAFGPLPIREGRHLDRDPGPEGFLEQMFSVEQHRIGG